MKIKSLSLNIIKFAVQIYRRFRSFLLALVILVFTLYTVQQFLWSTQKSGIFIRTDSVAYLWSAENLAKGLGIGRIDGGGTFVPYNHWPPLYPLLLAAVNRIGFSLPDAARWLGALFIALSIILVALMIARLTRSSPWYVLGALLILSSSTYFVDTNYYAMSEPLYIILSLSALLLINCYLERKKISFLVLASLLIGLTLLTRYVGISLLVACLVMLWLQKTPWRQKIQDSLLMGVLALIPVAVWLVRNIRLTGVAANRTFSIYSISKAEWRQAGNQIIGWFSSLFTAEPTGLIKPFLILILGFIAGLLYFRFFAPSKTGSNYRLLSLAVIYALSYAVFVIIARLMFDPDIPIYEIRIQYPLLLGCIFFVVAFLHNLQARSQQTSWVIPAAVVSVYILLAFLFLHAYRGEYLTQTYIGHNAGLGLARSIDPNLVSVLEQYPLDKYRFYSDDVEKLYYDSSYTIDSYSIFDKTPGQVEQFLSETSPGNAVIVIFDQKELGAEYKSQISGLKVVYEGEASIYAIP